MNYLYQGFQKQQLTHITAILLLIVLLVVGAIPGYFTGKWQWQSPPSVVSLPKLKQVRQMGLSLPGWQTLSHNSPEIGEHKWLLQNIKQADSDIKVTLMLLPQNGPRDRPEVEWTDIDNWANSQWGVWQKSTYRIAEFIVKQPAKKYSKDQLKIESRFFRSTTQLHSYAVLQWYATPTAGVTTPWEWFVADQIAQWQHQRIPWVAVSILMPMEPLGEVEKYWKLMHSLGEAVQIKLTTEVF